eukprot:scaffold13088_cov56-Phaeocystis_antarctica.AAC.4
MVELEVDEGLQLPDLGRQHLQLAAVEVELCDAVIAPPDASPRAGALAIGPPLLQRRARRPHRPQRDLVWLFIGAREPCFLHDVDGAAATGVGELGERGSGLEGLAEPGHVGGTGPGEDELEEGGDRQRLGEQEGVQLAWGVLVRLDDEEACVGRDSGLRRLSLLGAWGEGQLLAIAEEERQHLQRAAFEVELGEGLQLPDLRRQILHQAAIEDEYVELLDAVIAPRDALPRAWALAIGPPLLQRRARRPHRPQRVLVRL